MRVDRVDADATGSFFFRPRASASRAKYALMNARGAPPRGRGGASIGAGLDATIVERRGANRRAAVTFRGVPSRSDEWLEIAPFGHEMKIFLFTSFRVHD